MRDTEMTESGLGVDRHESAVAGLDEFDDGYVSCAKNQREPTPPRLAPMPSRASTTSPPSDVAHHPLQLTTDN
jgi:hypothetical protein